MYTDCKEPHGNVSLQRNVSFHWLSSPFFVITLIEFSFNPGFHRPDFILATLIQGMIHQGNLPPLDVHKKVSRRSGSHCYFLSKCPG